MELWIPERDDGSVAKILYFVYGNSGSDASLQVAQSTPGIDYSAWISQIANHLTSPRVQVQMHVSDTLVLNGTMDPKLNITYCNCVAPTDLMQPLSGPTKQMGLFILFDRQRLGDRHEVIGVIVDWEPPTTPNTGLGPRVVKVVLPDRG